MINDVPGGARPVVVVPHAVPRLPPEFVQTVLHGQNMFSLGLESGVLRDQLGITQGPYVDCVMQVDL